ncbi:DUF3558 domain-containing protein [Nocardia sp. CNY236]|uniref:DUF3558 domain-containing protein n=1 Tax=Nocardia sp. CNY236 TaxID=1169152 RepID=UPI0009DF3EB2|nr:DUF3558 domain-containing protein [Nocardia sp. CNY236]
MLAATVGLCAVLVLAGCGKQVPGQASARDEMSPQANAGQSATDAGLYDPCTLPDDAIVALGADPATKNDNPFRVPRAGWKGCAWIAGWHGLAVFATDYPISEFMANHTFRDFTDVDISGRKAMTFYQGVENSPPDNCIVVFDTPRGVVQLRIDDLARDRDKGADELCAVAVSSTESLNSLFPQ